MNDSAYVSIDLSDADDSDADQPPPLSKIPLNASAITVHIDSSCDPDHETIVREQRAIYDSYQYSTHVEVKPYKQTKNRLVPAEKPRFVWPQKVATERTALLGASSSRSTVSIASTATVSSVSSNKDQLPVDVTESLSRRTMTVRFCLYLLTYVSYLVLGSMVFSRLEGRNELQERQNFREVRQRFLRTYANVIGILKANGLGVELGRSEVNVNERRWPRRLNTIRSPESVFDQRS